MNTMNRTYTDFIWTRIVEQLAFFTTKGTFTFIPSPELLALPALRHNVFYDDDYDDATTISRGSPTRRGRLLREVTDAEIAEATEFLCQRLAERTGKSLHALSLEVGAQFNIRPHIIVKARQELLRKQQ